MITGGLFQMEERIILLLLGICSIILTIILHLYLERKKMVKVLFGLILQIVAIYCIGNSFFIQFILKSKGMGITFIFLGISFWAVGYFILHDSNKNKEIIK